LEPEPELMARRGPHAVPVEYLALDLGGLDGLVADELDLQRFLVVRANVLARPDEL
jgi:hypothetical protein